MAIRRRTTEPVRDGWWVVLRPEKWFDKAQTQHKERAGAELSNLRQLERAKRSSDNSKTKVGKSQGDSKKMGEERFGFEGRRCRGEAGEDHGSRRCPEKIALSRGVSRTADPPRGQSEGRGCSVEALGKIQVICLHTLGQQSLRGRQRWSQSTTFAKHKVTLCRLSDFM